MWRLSPRPGPRSKNWARSQYDGCDEPVIVRAGTADEAREVATAALGRQHHTRDTLFDPWSYEGDTIIERYEGSEFEIEGEEALLSPKRWA